MIKKIKNIIVLTICIVLQTSSLVAKNKEVRIIDNNIINKILSDFKINQSELKIYEATFETVKKEDWKSFDKLIKNIDNETIKGHLLASKYLSKTYRTSYNELTEWLETYSEYPQYNRLYKLAGRRGSSENLSQSLAYSSIIDTTPYGYQDTWHNAKYNFLPKNSRDYINQNVRQFRRYINSGKTLSARRILEDKKFINIMPQKTYDSMCGTLASLYFMDNLDELAIKWGEESSKRSDDAIGYWFTGLAAWRLGDYQKSAELFEALALTEKNDEWLISAAGYWGYRAFVKSSEVVKANEMLKIASIYDRTFYGILANYQLRKKIDYNWGQFSYINDFSNNDYIHVILSSDILKRAILLASLGEKDLFESEIKFGYRNFDDKQKEVAMFIAEQYGVYTVAIQISNDLKNRNSGFLYDYISYPVPKWDNDLWTMDRSLVLAFIKQESAFSKHAISPSGARGLMQVMPNTAYHVTRDKKIKNNRSKLFDKDFNLKVGQKYIEELLNSKNVDGNLFYLTTAYNAGPGNLSKWKKKVNDGGDPLMFIEAIPSKQTRIYIERVLANYWIYNYRLGVESLSIEQVANGLAPTLK